MDGSDSHLSDIRRRLETLERENRRLKKMSALVLLIGASVFLMGQAKSGRTIQAEEFLLKDNLGKTRARLATEAGLLDRPILYFYDKTAKLRVASTLP